MTKIGKVCPECGHEFQGNGWDGIDGHWRSKHTDIMSYEQAWPIISSGEYKRKKEPREDLNQAAARTTIREVTEDT